MKNGPRSYFCTDMIVTQTALIRTQSQTTANLLISHIKNFYAWLYQTWVKWYLISHLIKLVGFSLRVFVSRINILDDILSELHIWKYGYPSGALSLSALFSASPSLPMRLLEFQKSFREFWIFLSQHIRHMTSAAECIYLTKGSSSMRKILEKMYLIWLYRFYDIFRFDFKFEQNFFYVLCKSFLCQFLSGMSH